MNPRILILTILSLFAISLRANIIYEANFTGVNAPEETTFTFSGGTPKVTRDDSGYYYLGIKGGGPEFNHGETLTISFDRPVILQHIQFDQLFAGETVRLTQGSDIYRLSAFDNGNAARYSTNGNLLYTHSADLNGPLGAQFPMTSIFTLENPFGTEFITSLTLSAPKHSSFGLMSFNTMVGDPAPPAHVPDISMSLALMLLGLGALTLYARATSGSSLSVS